MNELFRALPALLRQFDDNEELRGAIALAAWKKVAGASLRRYTAPVRLDGERLLVAVSGEAWKRHLEELAGQMIFRINSVLGQPVVRFIEFRVDESKVAADQNRGDANALSEDEIIERSIGEINSQMLSSAEFIRDENLRAQFLLAAGSCLSRKRRIGESDD